MNDTADEETRDEIRLGASIDAAFIPAGVLIAAAVEIEELAEANGWDQPASVYIALDVRSSGIELDEATAAKIAGPIAAGNEVLAIGMLGQTDGNPREELVGFNAPENAVAIALVTESWTMPEDASAEERATLRPSEHPRRVESRDVLMQTADGRLLWCRRARGENTPSTVEVDPDGIKGPLIDVLRRCMGLGPKQQHDLVAEVCRAVSGAGVRAEMHERLPHTDPAMLAVLTAYSFTVAAAQAAATIAAAEGDTVSELTSEVIDDVDGLLRNANTAAQQRWENGEEWLGDMMLWLVDNIPTKVLAHSIAVNLLGLEAQAADWWQPSYIAQFVADEYDTTNSEVVVSEEEQHRLVTIAETRLQRLEALRASGTIPNSD